MTNHSLRFRTLDFQARVGNAEHQLEKFSFN